MLEKLLNKSDCKCGGVLKFTLVRNNSRARGYLPETIFCRGELPALEFFFKLCR